MAGMPRESALMPTIKCSTCGLQVEISSMGEHLCTGGSEDAADASLQSGFLGNLLSFAKPQTDRAPAARVPPRVDTSAANRSYATQGQLTPVSVSSGSRSVSPRTPNAPAGRRGPGRTDDYFAPKIAGEFDSPPQAGRRPGGYGGFADADVYDVDQPYGPSSPNKAGALLQRMNSMAPGPFESGARRPGAAAARNAFPSRNNPSADSPQDASPRPSNNKYAADNRPGTSAGRPSSPGGASLPRPPRGNGYEGFGKPQSSQDDFVPPPFGAGNRAETFPRPRIGVEAPARTPSAPGPRPGRLRRPSDASTAGSGAADRSRVPPTGMMRPDTSRGPPPNTSIMRPRAASKDGSGGVRAVDLAREFGLGNPYHSPSGSLSSSVSASSQSTHPKQPSSRTSPARSPDSRQPRPAETSRFDDLMSDLQSSMQDVDSKQLPPIPAPSTTASSSLRAAVGLHSQGMGFAKNAGRMDAQPPWSTEPRPRSPLASSDSPRGRDGPIRGQRDRSQRNPELAVPSARGDCRACGLAITGKSISSADGRLTGRYHKACFVCRACQAPFSSSTFYVIDDAPYCELHYHELNGSLCGSCGVGIEGQYLEDESLKKHHPGCFRCGDCGKVLQDGYFEVNGQAFCERDAWKRVQQPLPVSDGARQPPAMPESRLGLPSGPGPRGGPGTRAFGLPSGNRLGARPRMEKRMTRLGMM